MFRNSKQLGIAVAIALVWIPAFAPAQQPAPGGSTEQKPQKQWKAGEYALEDAGAKDTNPTTRLQKLDQWKKQFPESDYNDLRLQQYLVTYQQLNRPADVFNTAKAILAADPKNLQALSAIVYNAFRLNPPSADDLATAEKAANQLIANLDTLFGPDKKPAGVSDADWQKNKQEVHLLAQNALGWIAMQRKDYEHAEAEFLKSLQLDPTAAQVSYWLGMVTWAQKQPEKRSVALYHYARAAAYDGPGALAPAGRKDVQAYLEKLYAGYHGSKDGLDQLLAQAKTTALPPADLKIVSAAEIEEARLKKEQEEAAKNPMLTLWKNIKTALLAPDGQTYFDNSMKGAGLPGGANGVKQFKGKLISMKPAVRPKELVLGIENGSVADATLILDAPLPGKMEPGGEISFEGVATGFTKDPFLVTFEVEKSKIEGWEGKATTTPKKSTVRRRPAAK